MQSVSITELKSQLSHYLRRVERGEDILIRDGTGPAAKIVSVSTNDFRAEELELAADGIISLPEKELDIDAFLARISHRVTRQSA